MMNTILLRLFVEVSSKEKAESIIEQIISLIGKNYIIQTRKNEKYWKNEEWFEILMFLENLNDISLPVFDIEKRLGGNWLSESTTESFFNVEEGGESMIAEVKWAHIEVI